MFFSESESAYIFILSYIICMYFAYKYYEKKQYRWKIKSIWYLCLAATPFSLICAFRSIDCGYDTYNNINGFYNAELLHGGSESIEYIFYSGRYLILQLFGDHRVFLFLIAAIPISFFVVSFAKVAKNAGLCALGMLLYMLYVSPIMLDQSRQFIAMGICIYALFFLHTNRIKLFVLLVGIASLCHMTALSFFVFLVFSNRVISRNRYLRIACSIVIILSVFFLSHFTSMLYAVLPAKYLYIESNAVNEMSSGNAWLIDVLPMVFSILVYYRYNKHGNKDFVLLELCALSALPFRLGGYISFFIMRMSYYGELASILLLIYTLGQVPQKKKAYWSFASILVYFLHWYIDFVYLGLNGAIPYSCQF